MGRVPRRHLAFLLSSPARRSWAWQCQNRPRPCATPRFAAVLARDRSRCADRRGASADPVSKEKSASLAPTRMTTGDQPRRTREPRRRPSPTDLDQDGKLGFEEWAVKTIDKFEGADGDDDANLSAAEYAATAPKPKARKPACACG